MPRSLHIQSRGKPRFTASAAHGIDRESAFQIQPPVRSDGRPRANRSEVGHRTDRILMNVVLRSRTPGGGLEPTSQTSPRAIAGLTIGSRAESGVGRRL